MARRKAGYRAGRSKGRWRGRFVAALVAVSLVTAGFAWWQARHWTPPRGQFPVQGALLGESDGQVALASLKAVGARFVYLEASTGSEGRDASFAARWQEAGAAGLPHGAVHVFAPCIPAQDQAANFVTIVPRDPDMLPPVVALEEPATDCGPLGEAGIEGELTTFLNQVEGHTGKRAVLKLSKAFEARHALGPRIERDLWLAGFWFQPDYAGRPWTLWTANPYLDTQVSEGPIRWVVAQP